MVKRMMVVLGAMALVMAMVAASSAQVSGMSAGCASSGDMIMIAMKVT